VTTAGATAAPRSLQLWGLRWPEIQEGDDLVALLGAEDDLRDGDVVVITSKVLSKSEGRLVRGERDAAIASETRRVVARRGDTVIAETRHGLVMAAAGVDGSNTPAGTVLLLPLDPDESARGMRSGLYGATGLNIAVVVSDTAGRAWRVGQTDMAVGCAGLDPLLDLQGTYDTHGNELFVTAAAVSDELAAAADLVKGKASRRPVAVVRGLARAVLPPGEDGPGARALIREAETDFFGLGVREAVVAAALRADGQALDRFPRRWAGDPEPLSGLVDGWLAPLSPEQRAQQRLSLSPAPCPDAAGRPAWTLRVVLHDDAGPDLHVAVGRLLERADVLAAGHRLIGHQPSPARVEAGWGGTFARCWHDR